MRATGGLSSFINSTPGSLSAATFLPTFIGKGLSKAQRKKLISRRRRLFVDRVVVAHKRMHDKNRDLIIEETKRRLSLKKDKKPPIRPSLDRSKDNKWQHRVRPRADIIGDDNNKTIKEVRINQGGDWETWLQKITEDD